MVWLLPLALVKLVLSSIHQVYHQRAPHTQEEDPPTTSINFIPVLVPDPAPPPPPPPPTVINPMPKLLPSVLSWGLGT